MTQLSSDPKRLTNSSLAALVVIYTLLMIYLTTGDIRGGFQKERYYLFIFT